MKAYFAHLIHFVLVRLGLRPSDAKLELDKILQEENHKVYTQLEVDLEAISKSYNAEKQKINQTTN